MRVALVAGETSGDVLGAELIKSIRALAPSAEFFGIGGPDMTEAGCKSWFRTEELSVMGLTEVFRDLPRLLKIRRELNKNFLEMRPDIFIFVHRCQLI